MGLTTIDQTQLRRLLAEKIPDSDRIRILASDSGLKFGEISFSKAADLIWYDVLLAADLQDNGVVRLLLHVCTFAPALKSTPLVIAVLEDFVPSVPPAVSPPFMALPSTQTSSGTFLEAPLPFGPYFPDPPLLTILHITDLHFGQDKNQAIHTFDQDRVMLALLTDAAAMKKKVGSRYAILVTGDIAFSAQAYEHAEAKKWLDELCTAVGCTQVFMVPGNHDIDRKKAIGSRSSLEAHDGLRKKPGEIAYYLDHTQAERVAEFKIAVWPKFLSYAAFAKAYAAPQLSPSHALWKFEPSDASAVTLVG